MFETAESSVAEQLKLTDVVVKFAPLFG